MLLGVYVHLHHEKGMKGDKPSYIQFTVTRVTLNPRVILILTPPAHTAKKIRYICVLREKKLRGLSPKFHIHGSVSDLYIPMIGPPIFLQQNKQTDSESLT